MVLLVECYSTGAPEGTCNTLAPDPIKHEAGLQTIQSPYVLDIETFTDGKGGYHYEPGKTYRCKYSTSETLKIKSMHGMHLVQP